MEDSSIVELYWQRSERAVTETDAKYGAFCYGVAMNLLRIREDAEECVSDTYQAAWESMPTQRPTLLRPWLGRVVRNIALDLWRRNHARKRYGGVELMLSELEECVPAAGTVEGAIEAAELGRVIGAWLETLPQEDRMLFLRRYWYGVDLKTLAQEQRTAPGKLAQRMYRLRQSLRSALEKEGITL